MIIVTIQGKTLPEAYHRALQSLYMLGDDEYNKSWGCKRKEITALIEVEEPWAEPMISKIGIFGPRDLMKYVLELVDGIEDFEVENGNWEYTYHDRFVRQLSAVEEELTTNPGSTRAVLMIRNPYDIYMSDGPCLESIQFKINKGKLDTYATFRSNDAYGASFMNMFAIIWLAKTIADKIGVPQGKYVHYAKSFHTYERDWKKLRNAANRIVNEDISDLTYEYADDWAFEMMDHIPDIQIEVEELRERNS